LNRRYLVTGAAGFIGQHLARALSERPGASVFCVDNFVRGEDDEAYRELAGRSNVERIDCDLTDIEATRALPDVDVVFHLAALNGTQNFYQRPFDVVRHCTIPTLSLLERYGRGPLERFVYTGTSEAYASTVTRFGWPVPTAEDVPLGIDDPSNVRWSYGASKLHGEVAVFAAARQYGIAHTIIRYHNVYGPRMGDKHVVPDFLMRAKRGVFELFGGDDTRAFMYIDDAVEATLRVAEAESCRNEVVNIGGAREVRIDDLGRLMMESAGLQGDIAVHPSPAGSVKRRAPDLAKLHRLTGFAERWTLEEGLRETARFYLAGELAEARS
jgi:nucleoside-diphosphate-sugar epimerase